MPSERVTEAQITQSSLRTSLQGFFSGASLPESLLVQQIPQNTGSHLALETDLDLPRSLPEGTHSQRCVGDGCGDE